MTEIPDLLRDAFAQRLPILGAGFRLELVSFGSFGWGAGLRGVLRLTRASDGTSQDADVELIRGEDLGIDWTEVEGALDRWRARVAALDVDRAMALGVAGIAPWVEVDPAELERRWVAYLDLHGAETTAQAEDRRRSALADANAAFRRLEDHVHATWGLVLPHTLAVTHAFRLAIADLPEAVTGASGTRSGGVLDRLAPGGWDRAAVHDERLHDRFRRDPPEMLTFAWGGSDGLHFGLWFDADRAAGVVLNYARDSAETWFCGDRPLSVCRHRWQHTPPPTDETGFAIRRFLDELEWFEAHEQRLARGTSDLRHRRPLLGGPGSTPAAALPLDLEGRLRAYREDPRSVGAWLARARAELAAGRPAEALAFGRELHWFDGDAYREEAGELLIAAYEALGRSALAEIARVHLTHRDLPFVGVLS